MGAASRPACTALVSRTTHTPLAGSRARLVPVKPVCDTAVGGQRPPRVSKASPGPAPPGAAPPAEALGLAAGRGPAQGGRDHSVVGTDPPGGEPGQVRRRG